MADENFSPFVSIQLNKSNGIALYVQLADQIAFLIREGRLAPHLPLPPVRKLAETLAVNPGTVAAAYKKLEQEGFILSRRGSGSYVAERGGPAVAALSMPISEPAPAGNAIDMSRIALDPALFPTQTLKELISRIIDRDGPEAFTASESQGYLPLRRSLAGALAAEGIRTDAAHIQIVSGSQQGIDIAARTLLHHGSFVLCESPTYPGAVSVFRACGAKLADLPLTAKGLDPDRLEDMVRRYRPALLYLTPDIQVPTGITYTAAAKARILALARRYDFYILEDDYASGLWFTQPPRPMKALDTHDRVLYLRSVSSLLAPGLRLAYLVMPDALAPALRRVKYLSDIATAGLTQRLLALYLVEDRWLPYLAGAREMSRKKLLLALAAAEKYLPDAVRLTRPAGGLSLWLTLPEGTDARRVLARAEEMGYRFCDGAPFYPRSAPGREIRISFGAASPETLDAAFRTLGEILRDMQE